MSHSNETPFPCTPIACLENKKKKRKRKEIKRKDGKKKKPTVLVFQTRIRRPELYAAPSFHQPNI